MSTKRFVDPVAILAAAELLLSMADECKCESPTVRVIRKKNHCGCGCQPRDEFGRFTRQSTNPCRPAGPLPRWGVAGYPPEDKNKVFGVNVRVDEPRREDYSSQWAFERDHAKFDRLVDAAEACTWPNKSNTAPLHKVNCIRRSIFEDPVFATGGRNLIGETHWFE